MIKQQYVLPLKYIGAEVFKEIHSQGNLRDELGGLSNGQAKMPPQDWIV